VFWEVPSAIIPPESIKQERSTSGDDCHYNICDLPKRLARNTFIEIQPTGFEICAIGGIRFMTQADFDAIKDSKL
jgi:hypothetical protein